MGQNLRRNADGTPFKMSTNSWPVERWVAVLVLASLGLLFLIRAGFRGVNVMGARVSVG